MPDNNLKSVLEIVLTFALMILVLLGCGNKQVQTQLVKDFILDGEAKTEAIFLVDTVASKYLLSKESLKSPSDLEKRKVLFVHYKKDDHVVMTLHDLKSNGKYLTLYFYGLEGNHHEAIKRDVALLIDKLDNL